MRKKIANSEICARTSIPGRVLDRLLPQGTALVLEGGGLRGYYSGGVLEAFMQRGLMFPYIAGVSAGAANALSYVSGQPMRNRRVIEYFVGDPRYVGKRNLLLHRSMFNFDFIFRTVPQQYLPIDWSIFEKQKTRFLTGAVDCETGKTIWFEKEAVTPQCEVSIASCSVPVISPIVHFQGLSLLDGGVTDPIPIEKSLADGNRFHVVVLTRNQGYQKSAFTHKGLLKLFYTRYPALVAAMLRRHEVYNRQLALCEQLEREGRAVILRPLKPLQVTRTRADIPQLLALHDEGCEEGAAQIERILSLCENLTNL